MRAQRTTPKSARGLVLLALFLALLTMLVPSARVIAAPVIAQIACSDEDLAFMWPLENFAFGVFGLHETRSYGQLSWDLFSNDGNHARVVAPINGKVTEKWTDSKGNTAIKIENPCRYVWMLHGNWTEFEKEDTVTIGNVVGTQDNNGQSWDAVGECNGREGCAEHVHLDVYDKIKGDWIDPKGLTTTPTKVNESLTYRIRDALPDSPAEIASRLSRGWGDFVEILFNNLTWLILAVVVALGVTAIANGLSVKATMSIAGVILLAIAWLLPSTQSWLPSPLEGVTITTHYGDVRIDPNGTTGTTWEIQEGAKIRAITSGMVINTPPALDTFFGGQQVWINVGNKLYIQYALPEDAIIRVKPGSRVWGGQEIATTNSAGTLRLGVSSKSPTEFQSVDDRSYGWMDPEQYLGSETLSGMRKAQVIFQQLGLLLLVLAGFWPKIRKDNWPFPWDYRTARFFNVQLLLGFLVLSFGLTMDAPWFKWVGSPSVIVGVLYFSGRLRFRNRESWNVGLLPYVGLTMVVLTNFFFVGNMVVAAAANPDVTFSRKGYTLNLPNTVLPPLALSEEEKTTPSPWMVPPSGNNPGEFQFKYWNGGMYRFWVPQEVWDAAVAADKKHSCDARLIVAVAWSEGPNYHSNVCSSAGACGVWQFMPGTWDGFWRDTSPIPNRSDVVASADAACRKVIQQGLTSASSRSEFITRFAHRPLGGSVWNQHDGQAGTVWDLWQELIRRTTP